MNTRTIHSTITFRSPFRIGGFETAQAPGEYRVENEQELIDGLSRMAWHSVATFIYLPAIGIENGMQQMLRIDPAELALALEADIQRS